MAVRIPIYRQQTGTPQGRMMGGDPMVVRGPDVGGALMDLAQGVGAVVRSREQVRKEQEDANASAWAAKSLAETQSAAARRLIQLKQEAGEGGQGVVDGINAWMDEQTEALVQSAPNDRARNYIRERMLAYKGTLDLNALEYETVEQERWRVDSYNKGIESASAEAATMSGSGQERAAEQIAAIRADRTLSPDVRAKLIQNAVDSIAYAEVLGERERDPYITRDRLLTRLGMKPGTSIAEVSLARESAVETLTKIEEDAGMTVPVDKRQEVVANLMTGGFVRWENGQMVTGKGSGLQGESAGWAYDALPVPKVIELLSGAEAEIARLDRDREQAAEAGKVLFQQRLRDTTIALQNGEAVSLPTQAEMNFYLGEERGALAMSELMTYQAMAGELTSMDSLSNEALVGIIQTQRPTGTTNREFNQAAYQIKAQRIEQILAARNADPGQYVLTTNPTIQDAFEAYQAEVARVGQMGDSASEADRRRAIESQNRYIALNIMEQRRLGIRDPKLPKAFIQNITVDFQDGMNTNQPQLAAARLEALAQSMADTPEAITELAVSVGDMGKLAIDGVDGLTIKRIQAMAAVKEASRKEMLPPDVAWADIERAVTDEFAPMMATFAVTGDVETPARYIKAAQALVFEGVTKGQTVNDAAQAAYRDLFAGKNAAVGTYRVPLALNPPVVQTGLENFLGAMSADRIQIEAQPWMTPELVKLEGDRKLRTIRENARWVNNQMGDGVFLMHAGGPVLGADGLPIEVKFTDAIKYSTEMQPPPSIIKQTRQQGIIR